VEHAGRRGLVEHWQAKAELRSGRPRISSIGFGLKPNGKMIVSIVRAERSSRRELYSARNLVEA
jgi:hypothetical protein